MNETLLSVTGFEHRVLETLEESPFGGLYAASYNGKSECYDLDLFRRFTTMPWRACAAIRHWLLSTPVKLRSTGWSATVWKAASARSAVTDFSHPAQNEGR